MSLELSLLTLSLGQWILSGLDRLGRFSGLTTLSLVSNMEFRLH